MAPPFSGTCHVSATANAENPGSSSASGAVAVEMPVGIACGGGSSRRTSAAAGVGGLAVGSMGTDGSAATTAGSGGVADPGSGSTAGAVVGTAGASGTVIAGPSVVAAAGSSDSTAWVAVAASLDWLSAATSG